VNLRLVTPTHPAAAPLLAGLRHEYAQIYGPDVAAEVDRYSAFEFLPPAGAFIVLEIDGVTVAGGALRRLAPGVGEIKRMWTAPQHRGRGYSRRILAALEAAAVRRGYHTLRLETGDLMEAAIGLYRSSGYTAIATYGDYWGTDPRCRCFEKQLDGAYDLTTDELDLREILVREMLKHHPLDAGLRQAA
jgi:GNAT superfamily N-acetyltransferase